MKYPQPPKGKPLTFDKMDTNKDNMISWEEYLGFHSAKLNKKFSKADKDDDGFLSEHEYKRRNRRKKKKQTKPKPTNTAIHPTTTQAP